jgi:hypothetical protein
LKRSWMGDGDGEGRLISEMEEISWWLRNEWSASEKTMSR